MAGLGGAVNRFVAEVDCVVRPEWIDANGHMNLAYYVVAFDLATDALYDVLGIGQLYRDTTPYSCFTVETHTLYEREMLVGEKLRVGAQVLARDDKRLIYFHEMFHSGTGERVAVQELLALHIDMRVRRVTPFPEDRRAAIDAVLHQREGTPLPKGAGRRITLERLPRG
jgi:acyl-CoA thioester hydrolase